jgi:endonuclease/exonuclease/phosphatase family metal-dependent hydrolase
VKIRLWPKRWWARLLLVGLGVVFIPYAFSRIASPWRCVSVHSLSNQASSSRAPSNRLRVVTYNIAHGRGPIEDNWKGGTADERLARLNRIGDLLKEMHADVIVLNEVDFDSSWSFGVDQAAYLAERAGYTHWAEERNLDFRVLWRTWRFGNAVLSRYPIVEAREVSLPGEVGWETILAGKKRGVLCKLDANGTQFQVLAAHLSHRSEPVRVASAQMILNLAAAADSPILVAGDLNSTPTGFPHSHIDAGGKNAIDVLDASGQFIRRPELAPQESGMTYPSIDGKSVIDWILIPKSWQFHDYQVKLSELSDHRPVIAEIHIAPSNERSQRD